MVVKEAIMSLPEVWFRFITKTPLRCALMKFLSVAMISLFAVSDILVLIYYPGTVTLLTFRWLIWGLLFAGSIWFAWLQNGRYMFYGMFVVLILLNYVLWIIPILLFCYIIYLGLERWRRNKIEEIAKSSPEALAGITNKPKIVIQVRKD